MEDGWQAKSAVSLLQSCNKLVYTQGSFPAGTPGNGVPKVILTVGMTLKPALGELYKKHPVCTKIRLFEIENRTKIFLGFSGERAQIWKRSLPIRSVHVEQFNFGVYVPFKYLIHY